MIQTGMIEPLIKHPPERPYTESTPYWESVKTNMCELGGQCSNCCDANYNCREFRRPK